MSLGWLLDVFPEYQGEAAIVWSDRAYTYGMLLEKIQTALAFLAEYGTEGQVLLLDADFSPNSVALLLAAIHLDMVVVPVAANVENLDRDRYASIAQATLAVQVNSDDQFEGSRLRSLDSVDHPLLKRLIADASPGLVLFSSGSTGEPKATLHDLRSLLSRFRRPRHSQRMITFLLFDHIGGFNTLMYTLSGHGCVITLADRTPDAVCRAIATHKAEVLPTSPTFLNLLLMSGALDRFDLSSLKVINYATEVMPATTLARINKRLPGVAFHQSYGLSEMGILRTKSKSSDSLWVRIVNENCETRIVDGVMQIKSESSMMGYLNAPSPFTDDGWFNTQDEVEVDGEWIRFKGRKSDIINVGGEKVYPAEVESVILEVDNVDDATVGKEPHPFTGNIVVAQVSLKRSEPFDDVSKRIRKHCFTKLPSFKVPVKISQVEGARITDRFKRVR